MSTAAAPNGETGSMIERAIARARRWDEATADSGRFDTRESGSTNRRHAAQEERERGLLSRLGGAAADRMAELTAARNADRIAALLQRPDELAFALELITRVGGIEDPAAAGREFDRLSRRMPRSFAAPWRVAALLGGGFAPVLPRTVVPVARRLLRHLVSHLVLDASPARLTASLARVDGDLVSALPLGPTVVGPASAERRLASVLTLLDRDDLGEVQVPIPVLLPSRSPWAFDHAVDRLAAHFAELVDASGSREAAPQPVLRVEHAAELDLAVATLIAVFDRESRQALEPSLVVSTVLPGVHSTIAQLAEWFRVRTEPDGSDGGRAGMALTLDTIVAASAGSGAVPHPASDHGAGLAELVALALGSHGFARVAVHGSRSIDLAIAWEVAEELGATDRLRLSVPLGFDALRAAIATECGGVGTRAPVADPDDFAPAIEQVVQLITHSAATGAPGPSRGTDDADAAAERPAVGGLPAPLFDPANASDRDRVRAVVDRSSTSALGVTTIAAAELTTAAAIEEAVARGIAAAWRLDDPSASVGESTARAALLRRLPAALRDARDALVEVLLAEPGMLVDEAAAEVELAITAVEQQSSSAKRLIDELRAVPTALDADAVVPRLLVVEPSASAPLSNTLLAAVAAWALGGSVVVVPPVTARRSLAVLAETVWGAGVTAATWQLAAVEDPALRDSLLRHPRVNAVASWAADAAPVPRTTSEGLLADIPRIGGDPVPGVMVVTASADLEQAATDAARSAFAQAGQHPRAIARVFLVGAAGESDRFRATLVDAATALVPGWPGDLDATLGPLRERAGGEVVAALIDLGEGQRWLREPAPLDFSRRLWAAGIREHEQTPEALSRRAPAPVLDVHTVATLDEAIELQRRITGGADAAVAALHSRDPDEVRQWLDEVDAADLVVNAATVDTPPPASALWTAAEVGTNPLAQHDESLIVALCRWRSRAAAEGRSLSMAGIDERSVPLIEAAQPGLSYPEFDRVRRAARSDRVTSRARDGWRFADTADRHAAVGVAAARHRPTFVLIRLAEEAALADLVQVLLAAAAAEAPVTVSSAVPLPAPFARALRDPLSPLVVEALAVESDAEFARRLGAAEEDSALRFDGEPVDRSRIGSAGVGRIRLISARALHPTLSAPEGVVVAAHPVVEAGRVEVAWFQRGQTVVFGPGSTERFIAEVLDFDDPEPGRD